MGDEQRQGKGIGYYPASEFVSLVDRLQIHGVNEFLATAFLAIAEAGEGEPTPEENEKAMEREIFLRRNYHSNTIRFREIVTFRYALESLRKSQRNKEDGNRWESPGDIPATIKDNVRILSFENEHIGVKRKRISELANLIFQERNPQLRNPLRYEYTKLVQEVITFVAQEYNPNRSNLWGITMLRGAKPLEAYFPTGVTTEVNAKRIPSSDQLHVGFNDWTNLDESKAQFGEKPTLVIYDDCAATFSSVLAAITALKAKAKRGECTDFRDVEIYVTFSTQQGIEFLFGELEKLGINAKLVCGEITYRLSDLFYLLNDDGSATVGDMGDNMMNPDEFAAYEA